MFWLINNVIVNNYEFIMEFLNYEKINIDNNIIYIFNDDIDKDNIKYDYVINCNIKIKENIILYTFNNIELCFSFKLDEYFNESKIKYYYKKENIERMPRLLLTQYDTNEDIIFNIKKINESSLLIYEISNNYKRNYNIYI